MARVVEFLLAGSQKFSLPIGEEQFIGGAGAL